MEKKKKFITCDGNEAASHIAYMFSEVAAIYPITPSSNMAENVDEWAAMGRKNIFGEEVKVVEMQSEAGAAGSVHGALQSGALTTTFTASQGLLLMIPNMYKIAGELLPAVFHVSARSVAAHALSIFGDHSDVYATRQTGFAMLASGSIQEIMDLAGIAHLAAIKSRIPFLHFFDGFRSSHEIQKVEYWNNDDLSGLIDHKALQAFRDQALNPEHPVMKGTAQNPDIFFQAKESINRFYEPVADIVENYMDEIFKLSGRRYHPFVYDGHPEAENVIIAMGSATETIREVVDYLVKKGEKVGLVAVHLFRPFSEKYFFNVLPSTAKRLCVLDRAKEPGANGEPLYLEVRDLFYEKENRPMIIGGRYGLSSKDTVPSQILAVFENLMSSQPKNRFTIGITDDVTFTSLPILPDVDMQPEGSYSGKFYGLGSDGTVGANKNSIKIIGDSTDKYVQAYFSYDSKKSGGITVSHLRFGDQPIRSTYLVNTPDFVACHVPSYLDKYDMLKGLKNGGTFLLNSIWDAEESKNRFPDHMKHYLAANNIRFFIINATKIAEEIGLGNRTNSIMQSAFFKVSNVIPYEQAITQMKDAVKKTYGKKGEEIVKMNMLAIDRGGEPEQVEVPSEWVKLDGTIPPKKSNIQDPALNKFVNDIFIPIYQLKGDDIPVSAFVGREDGSFPAGTTTLEKRGIAVNVPQWLPEHCIQCNQCAFVCPHAAIRPFLLDEKEKAAAPKGIQTIKAAGKELAGLEFKIQVSVFDCTGCGNCVDVCPSKTKSLVLQKLETQLHETINWDYLVNHATHKEAVAPRDKTFKNSQFAKPLFEFSGACAGCGETPYIKVITQLFGERMMVANATGCSSIYGGTAPSSPYCPEVNGKGPAWANSLFEDNAEYGFGMAVGVRKLRERIARMMAESRKKNNLSADTYQVFQEWTQGMNDAGKSVAATEKLLPLLLKENDQIVKDILDLKQYLIKKSIWIVGGDGWAYDIGFGGLDHVLAMNEDVNMLVLDTEVYSNTGGQSSKSTPFGSVAKFAASGKKTSKKDLGAMAITYGYVYVAQVAMGASYSQFFKTIKEAEAYPGPSLIIAYSPCINHGIRAGMEKSQEESDRAVKSGYFHLYRYNPLLAHEGKNPFILDSKEPEWSEFRKFLESEVRYMALKKTFPSEAERLFKAAEENARWKYNSYKQMSELNYSI
ncbi:MAG: pyruvate:ferredoxin (flavodoxin) oxidoreductase [Bacteroidetes bacterium]|nr:pyruvate:ferredoxin (flavodoxin) oxidoreductase [Bacteroidota bacterium]